VYDQEALNYLNLASSKINKQYFPREKDKLVEKYLRNLDIVSPSLLVIDDEGTSLGVIEREKALAIAQEKELDLIEVSGKSNPPVAKIMSWSKFKYQQEKKQKENKSKGTEIKEMWFKSFIGEGDLAHKLKKVDSFLAKKHPVKITIKAKGRVGRMQLESVLQNILGKLEGKIEYDQPPKFYGRDLSLIVRPIKITKQNEKQTEDTQSNS
jgi:translation initiation factor IF-3